MKTLYNQLWRISHHYLGDEEQNNFTLILSIWLYIYIFESRSEGDYWIICWFNMMYDCIIRLVACGIYNSGDIFIIKSIYWTNIYIHQYLWSICDPQKDCKFIYIHKFCLVCFGSFYEYLRQPQACKLGWKAKQFWFH